MRSLGRASEAYELLDQAAVLVIRHIGGVQRRTQARANDER